MNRLGSLEIRKNRVITASAMVTTASDSRPALPPPLPFDGLFSDESLASCLITPQDARPSQNVGVCSCADRREAQSLVRGN
jgi:hypothetical protein